jgi:putative hemolysin
MLHIVLRGGLALLFGVTTASAAEKTKANPAALLCVADGAQIVVETASNGSEHAVCVFPDGSRINAWAYFRNKHRTTE